MILEDLTYPDTPVERVKIYRVDYRISGLIDPKEIAAVCDWLKNYFEDAWAHAYASVAKSGARSEVHFVARVKS